MTPLTQTDLLSHADYETQRPAFQREVIGLKKRRRIEVGPLVTLIFENRETLRFQIQEMIRAERIFEPAKIQEELYFVSLNLTNPLRPDRFRAAHRERETSTVFLINGTTARLANLHNFKIGESDTSDTVMFTQTADGAASPAI